MSTTHKRIAEAGLAFILIFLSGLVLSLSGRPLNVLILTAHKLIALAVFVFLVVTIYRVNRTARLSTVETTAAAISSLFFISTIITGGLMSTESPMPPFVPTLHQVLPFLTVLATGVTLFLLLNPEQQNNT